MKNINIKEMFDRIAPWYDFLNRLLSARQDVRWRKEMVKALDLSERGKLLDMACGTGDVAFEASDRHPHTMIVASDFAVNMLIQCQKKSFLKNTQAKIRLIAGDALHLPLKPATFDAITIAFGIRNIAEKKEALKAFHGILNPGGRLAVLELTPPTKGLLLSAYLVYFTKVLPIIGRLFSKHPDAYTYLPHSVLNFPSPPAFAGIMRQAGFRDIRYKSMSMGIVTLFVGEKV